MLLLFLSPTMLKWGFAAMSLLFVTVKVVGSWTPSTHRQWRDKQKHGPHSMRRWHPYMYTRYLSPQLFLSPPHSPLRARMGFCGRESHEHVLQDCGKLTHQNHRWHNKQKISSLSTTLPTIHLTATFNLILPPATLYLALQLHSLSDKNTTLHLVPKLWFSCATYVDWQTMMPVKR